MNDFIKFGLFFFQLLDICAQEKCTLSEACEKVEKLGYKTLEIDFDQLSEETLGTLAGSPLQIVNIYCFLDFQKDVEPRLNQLLKNAQCVRPKFVMPIPETDETADLKNIVISRLILLQQQLADIGTQMVMENYDGPGKSFATISGLQEYFKAIPGLKCCFDTGNFYYSGEDLLHAYNTFSGNIVHIHCKDRRLDEKDGWLSSKMADGTRVSNAAIGNGILPLAQLFSRLESDKYQGILVAEHACVNNQLDTLTRSISTMKLLLSENQSRRL
ncbi:MAG: sugar phosphate isomerase/epimerase [Oligosphaeraceae bacterium]|nr:sugar phosphate isomerase/epimerase [Oligosphaeraceae bacterium]